MRIMSLEGLSDLGQDDCSRFLAEAQQIVDAAPTSAAALIADAKTNPAKAEQDLETWKTLRVYALGVASRASICGDDDLVQQVQDAVAEVDRAAEKARARISSGAAGGLPIWALAGGAAVLSLGAVFLLRRRGGLSGCGCRR